MAKTALVSEINKETLKHPEWQFAKTIQVKDVEYNTEVIDLMRGNKFRAIAYIKKDNIHVIFDDKTPEITVIDKETKSVEEKKETPAPVPVQEKVQPKVEETSVSVPDVQPKVEETPVTVPEAQPRVPVVNNRTNTGNLLDQIVAASSISEVQKILDTNKRSGKVVSGTMDKLEAADKAYLVVYKKTGEIVAILDKGSANNRKDLLSGETKGNNIFENNQTIWFILF